MKVPYQGRLIEAEELETRTSNEYWNVYKLPNDKMLCVKTILISVFKSTEEKDSEGNLVYIVKTNTVVKVK